jgi:hypothetical protein
MEGEVRSIRDHEEWTKIVADSDTGAYVMQGFVVHDQTMNRPVTDRRAIEKAVRHLARRKGWDLQLTGYAGTLAGVIPTGETFDRLEFGDDGGCRLVVPVDYLAQLDDRGGGIPHPARRLRAGLPGGGSGCPARRAVSAASRVRLHVRVCVEGRDALHV